jgi:hypothetical protein
MLNPSATETDMLIYDVPTDQLERRLEAKRAEFKKPGLTPIEKFRITSDCSVIMTAISWRKRWIDGKEQVNGN